MTPRRQSASGFTLIEIMIAMALLAMLSVGMLTTVNAIGRAQRGAAAIDAAQSGARAGLEMITRDVEMASAGAKSGTINFATGGTASLLAVRVTDGNNAPDQLDIITIDPTAQGTLLTPYAAGATNLSVSSSAGFAVGDQVQVSDLITAVVVVVTGTANNGGNPGLQINANTNALPQTFPAGSYVFRTRAVSYYIDTTTFGAQDPLLMLDPDGPGAQAGQPLAEGVEDLQVALGVDGSGDGLISSVGSAAGDDEWVGNVAGEVAPVNLTQLRSVRVTLVARTIMPTAGLRGQRPAAENHAGGLTADSFSRRVLRSELTVRNFNL